MRLFSIVFVRSHSHGGVGRDGPDQVGDMTVDVPFAFLVDGQTLAAGHYIVAPIDVNHQNIQFAN